MAYLAVPLPAVDGGKGTNSRQCGPYPLIPCPALWAVVPFVIYEWSVLRSC